EIGKDISADYLKKKFDAIVVAIGTPIPRDLQIPGRELKNIYFALDFLSGQNRANSGELKMTPINVKGKDVVIIGGGDTGSDCLGTSIRQKARRVTQIEIMPEPPEKRSEATPWPDWSYELRTSSSHKEGGERLWSKVIKEFKGKDGILKEIELVDAEWKTENGRPVSFTEKPETKTILKADYVFIAMGFLGVNADSFIKDLGLETDKRGRAASSAAKGIFTCGDTKCGQSLVVRAMTDAKKTADEGNEYLKG
ncbi:MAG: FAD-dependent oxidoreductase, partial [Mucispirillum sp.]|nr:FAD-dependent oxidoreductase [Mucispirillum sp.]